MRIIQFPSPNYSSSVYKKRGVQIHKTLGTDSLEWLCDPRSNASAHYLIARNGDIYQLVQLKNRAWTAGKISKPNKRGKEFMAKDFEGKWIKPGFYAVQIEVEGLLNETYTEQQYKSLIWLFKTFDFEISNNSFLTHKDTCWYKPNLEKERTEILRRLGVESQEEEIKRLQEMIIVLTTQVIQLYKKILFRITYS